MLTCNKDFNIIAQVDFLSPVFTSLLSDGYTVDDLVFHWKNLVNPVQFNENMRLPEFNITGYQLERNIVTYVTGNSKPYVTKWLQIIGYCEILFNKADISIHQ